MECDQRIKTITDTLDEIITSLKTEIETLKREKDTLQQALETAQKERDLFKQECESSILNNAALLKEIIARAKETMLPQTPTTVIEPLPVVQSVAAAAASSMAVPEHPPIIPSTLTELSTGVLSPPKPVVADAGPVVTVPVVMDQDQSTALPPAPSMVQEVRTPAAGPVVPSPKPLVVEPVMAASVITAPIVSPKPMTDVVVRPSPRMGAAPSPRRTPRLTPKPATPVVSAPQVQQEMTSVPSILPTGPSAVVEPGVVQQKTPQQQTVVEQTYIASSITTSMEPPGAAEATHPPSPRKPIDLDAMVRAAQEKRKRIHEIMEGNGQLQAILAEGDKGDGDVDIPIGKPLPTSDGEESDGVDSADEEMMDGTTKRGRKGKRGGANGAGRGKRQKKPSDQELDEVSTPIATNMDAVSPASSMLAEGSEFV